MATKEQVSAIMAELGPLMELAAVVEYADAGTWRLDVNDETTVFVELDEDSAVLTLSSEVAALPSSTDLDRLYRLLLQCNGHPERTGGLTLGLDSEDVVTQSLRMPAAGLDRSGLAETVAGFIQRLDGWRTIVRDFNAAPSAGDPQDMTGYLRV